MEVELIRAILNIPYDVYKSWNYESNSIDTYSNTWQIYYKKSKKSQYIVRVQSWNDNTIHITIDVDYYPLRAEYAPKYLIKIITRISNYLSILGFTIGKIYDYR